MQKRAQPDAAITCKRKGILRLALQEYQRWAKPITDGFERAAQLLDSQRIVAARDVPHTTQFIPLAAMFVALGDAAEREDLCGPNWPAGTGAAFLANSMGSVETYFARDLPDMLDWVAGCSEPLTVLEAHFSPGRLRRMRTRNSAAYKGLSALLLYDGALDFGSGSLSGCATLSEGNGAVHTEAPASDRALGDGDARRVADTQTGPPSAGACVPVCITGLPTHYYGADRIASWRAQA
jgi:hypothetical protein